MGQKTDGERAGHAHRITLKPQNPDFDPIEILVEDEGQVHVVAEFLKVVG